MDLPLINRYYGTSLQEGDFAVKTIHPVIRALYGLDCDASNYQARCYLLRVCQRIGRDYDVVISADNEVDFGCRGIQYIHLPSLGPLYQKSFVDSDAPWREKVVGLLKGRYRPWMIVARHSFKRLKQNYSLVNSQWTGRWVRQVYGIDSEVLYPPVPGRFPEIPWEDREDGFVCIGRFSGSKRFERIVEIVLRVRQKHPHVKLHVIGSKPWFPQEPAYCRKISGLFRRHASWIQVHEDLSRSELVELVVRHRYGIHGADDEHFGIAPAELLNGGCILFVPNNGGQVEIVGRDERLTYEDNADAVKKILRLMEHPAEQLAVRRSLKARRTVFSAERFVEDFRCCVGRFIDEKDEQSCQEIH
jgi:glycosyltransferase involved in cell wall biosynthesis